MGTTADLSPSTSKTALLRAGYSVPKEKEGPTLFATKQLAQSAENASQILRCSLLLPSSASIRQLMGSVDDVSRDAATDADRDEEEEELVL